MLAVPRLPSSALSITEPRIPPRQEKPPLLPGVTGLPPNPKVVVVPPAPTPTKPAALPAPVVPPAPKVPPNPVPPPVNVPEITPPVEIEALPLCPELGEPEPLPGDTPGVTSSGAPASAVPFTGGGWSGSL